MSVRIQASDEALARNAGTTAAKAAAVVQQLRARFGRVSSPQEQEAIKASLLPAFARGIGCRTAVSESRLNAGAVTFDSADPNWEAARKAYRRLWAAVWAPAQAAKPAPQLRVSAAARSAAKALLDACGGDPRKAAAALKAVK